MDSLERKDYLLNSLCRICAEKSSKLIPIFEIKLLPVKINKCLPIRVSVDDEELPNKVCDVCLIKIDESFMLYESCYYADQRLRKLWNSLSKPSSVAELSITDNTQSSEILNYAQNSDSDDRSIDVLNSNGSKKDPDSMILVSAGLSFDQRYESQDLHWRNRCGEVLSPTNIIINVTNDVGYGNLNILESGKDHSVEFIADNENNTCPNEMTVAEPHMRIHSNGNSEVKFTEEDNVKTKKLEKQDVKQTQTKTSQCKFFPHVFNTASSLAVHESNHSQDKSFLCDTCGKAFKHANNLKSHTKIHSAHRKKYACEICNKAFYTNFFLHEHMNSHTGETPYKCGLCGKEFREKVHLRQHKWTHSVKKFLCPICGNHFSRKGNMTEHIKKFHPSNENETYKSKKEVKKSTESKFSCPVCSRTFASQLLMKNHHKRHTNSGHFCSLCGKQFKHSGSLTYHRRAAHTGEKPFQCSYCEDRFTLRSVQRIHERKKHTFECPYKCQFCSRMFTNSSSLKNHSYVHMKEKMFECDVCGKKFTRSSNLLVHKKIHTDDRQFTCEQCGKSYIQKHDMIKHRRVHDPKSKPFFCKYCGNNFAHKREFAKHAICHFDYIRKSNSEKCTAEKILDTVTGDLNKTIQTLNEAERLILESSEILLEEKLEKTDIT